MWSSVEDYPMPRFSLALLVAFCFLAPASSQTPEQKKATIAYVRSLQTDAGGFRPSEKEREPNLRATTGALRALKYFGGEPRDRDRCRDFVASCYDKESGGFADHPGGKPDVPLTAVGLMAVVELKMPADKYIESGVKYLVDNAKQFEEIRMAAAGVEAINKRPLRADAWLKQLAQMRNKEGTFGKHTGQARDTGGAVAAVLRLGGDVDQRDNVLAVLRAGQRADGGFGKADTKASDLESTYRIMRCFHMLKTQPADVDALRRFLAGCRNADGGYGLAPDQPSTVGSTYFAAIILHWLDER
jgi:prenyltransferase beta subunit